MTQGHVPTACIHVSIDLRGADLKVEVSSSCGSHFKLFLSHGSCSLERRRSSCLGWWLERSSVPRLLRAAENLMGQKFPGLMVLRSEGRKPSSLFSFCDLGSSYPEY